MSLSHSRTSEPRTRPSRRTRPKARRHIVVDAGLALRLRGVFAGSDVRFELKHIQIHGSNSNCEFGERRWGVSSAPTFASDLNTFKFRIANSELRPLTAASASPPAQRIRNS